MSRPAPTLTIPQPGAAGAVATDPAGQVVADPAPCTVTVPALEVEHVVRFARPQGLLTGAVVMVDGTRHTTTDVDRVLHDLRAVQQARRRGGAA